MRRLTALVLVLLATTPATAGLYSLDDPCPFEVTPDGTAAPLPNDLFVARITNRETPGTPSYPAKQATADWATADEHRCRSLGSPGRARGGASTGSGRLGQLVAARWPKADALTEADLPRTPPSSCSSPAPRSRRRTPTGWNNSSWPTAATRSPRPRSPTCTRFRGGGRRRKCRCPTRRAWPTRRPAPQPPSFAGSGRWRPPPTAAGSTCGGLTPKPAAPPKTPTRPPTRCSSPTASRSATGRGRARRGSCRPTRSLRCSNCSWAPWDDQLLWTLAEVNWAKGDVRAAHRLYLMLTEGRAYQEPLMLPARVKLVNAAFEKLPPEGSVSLPGSDLRPPHHRNRRRPRCWCSG